MLPKLLSAACCALVLTLTSTPSQAGTDNAINSISQQQLLARQQAAQDMLLLDVRSDEEYAAGHIPGAVNVAHTELANNLQTLLPFKDKDVVVYCRSGRRAAMAIEQLQQLGFSKVSHLEGDMNLWQENNQPVEK